MSATTQDWLARCAAAQHSNPPQPFPEAALFRHLAAHDAWLARADFSFAIEDRKPYRLLVVPADRRTKFLVSVQPPDRNAGEALV